MTVSALVETVRRRVLLRSLATVGPVALAGCSSQGDPDGAPKDEDGRADDEQFGLRKTRTRGPTRRTSGTVSPSNASPAST